MRFVLVPGLTDAEENVAAVAAFVATLHGVETGRGPSLSPAGACKWADLRLRYQLGQVAPPEVALVKRVERQFHSQGLNVV